MKANVFNAIGSHTGENKQKIIILTDSLGNPRNFPIEMAVNLKETYRYKTWGMFPEAIVW